MKNKWIRYASYLLCTVMFASCNSSVNNKTEATDSVIVNHKLGKTVVYGEPSRVVVFDFGALENLNELGLRPVAIPKNFTPDHLSELKNDNSIEDAGGLMEPNFEKINSLSPDLIIISARQEKFYDEFQKIAPTIFIHLDNSNYIQSFEENTLLIARLIGKEAEAETKIEATKSKLAEAQDKLGAHEENALVTMHNNGRFSVYGAGSRFGFIHAELGVKPALEQLEDATHGQRVSNEFILEANPDYLFIVDRNEAVKGKGASKQEIENKLIQQTKAYKNGKIIYLNPQVWYLSGGGITSTNMMIDEILGVVK